MYARFMWLYTTYGIYSIVRRDDGMYQVRSRWLGHLEILRAVTGITVKIKTNLNRDYKYRMILNEDEYWRVMEVITASVEYPDFKTHLQYGTDMFDSPSAKAAYYGAYFTAYEAAEV